MDRLSSVIDVRGEGCPYYLVAARWAMDHCRPGATVTILGTDPDLPRDLEAFCRRTGHCVVDSSTSGSEYMFVVRKGSAAPVPGAAA